MANPGAGAGDHDFHAAILLTLVVCSSVIVVQSHLDVDNLCPLYGKEADFGQQGQPHYQTHGRHESNGKRCSLGSLRGT